MAGDPMTWQQWWDTVAMSGFAGSVVGGAATALAVVLTLRGQASFNRGVEVRRVAAEAQQVASGVMNALGHRNRDKLSKTDVADKYVAPLNLMLWRLYAEARTEIRLRSETMFLIEQIGRQFPAGAPTDLHLDHFRLIARSAVVFLQEWLVDPKEAGTFATMRDRPDWRELDARIAAMTPPPEAEEPAG